MALFSAELTQSSNLKLGPTFHVLTLTMFAYGQLQLD
jgi:hypothetical protein